MKHLFLLCFSSVVLYVERRSRSSMEPPPSPVSSYPVGPGGSVTGSYMGSSSHLANGLLVQSPKQQHRTASGKFCSAVGWK
jgi:threonine synthase